MGDNSFLIKIAIAVVVGFLFVRLISWYIRTFNKLNKYKVVIQESKENVDIALAKRYDTISEMLKVAKSYARHERETFADLIKLRGGATIKEMDEAIKSQDMVIDRIFALAEAYPDLKSSEQFLNLQNEINDENEQLAAAKRIVNNNISILNQAIVSFPTSVVAKVNGIGQTEFLKGDNLAGKKSLADLDYEI